MPGNTRTGAEYKRLIELRLRPIVERKNFRVEKNKKISLPGGMTVTIPFVLVSNQDEDRRYLIDTMVMNTSCTAQFKATNSLMQMWRIMAMDKRYKSAVLVRGGDKWSQVYVDFLTDEFAVHVPRAKERVFSVNSDQLTRLMSTLL